MALTRRVRRKKTGSEDRPAPEATAAAPEPRTSPETVDATAGQAAAGTAPADAPPGAPEVAALAPELAAGTSADAEADPPADAQADPEAEPEADPKADPKARAAQEPDSRRGLFLANAWPLNLLRAAHPRQGVLTALAMGAAALLAGRPDREVALVAVTVLVGQTVLGWHNDLVDRDRDRRLQVGGKPLADGRLDPGTVWFSLICAVLLLVPLSVANGITAGSAYLLSVVVALMGNVVLRRGWSSWLPWAAAYALLPAFLSYGGWGGDALGDPPEIWVTVLAALLGVGVHVLRALPGLVAAHEDGSRSLPLRIALKIGAPKLLLVAIVYTVVVVAALLVAGDLVGLAQ